jgi:maltooligosyltrehalose trehalohydrolase
MAWQPKLGALNAGARTSFRVWAPDKESVALVVERASGKVDRYPLVPSTDGYFTGVDLAVRAGELYTYAVNGRGPFPDPASRFQPRGVHGPSQVIDPSRFEWSDAEWAGVALSDLILYEVHTGAFTPEGTFTAAREKLPLLRDLGVTGVELMPVADFPGDRNWGYDGVALFAPARCYGTPDDLRSFVDTAHMLGLAVHLDVVYNHLGPDGAYLGEFSPYYYSTRHKNLWGAGINFDGNQSPAVRDFFIENALHWIHEYHIDGLRLDATHAIVDESPRHILAALQSAVHGAMAGTRRRVLIIAEDHRNLVSIVRPEQDGGWGLDGVWADDFHHQMRRCLAGDHDGYFADFRGSVEDVAVTLRQGWFYRGQDSRYLGGRRGTDPGAAQFPAFVFCLQNHDQIGNRAFGDRLHQVIEPAAYRAAIVLLLLAPETPLLFMGQEWAATTPFRYFTDHHPELGRLVTEGRRREFSQFVAFAAPEARDRIPDPQRLDTFEASRLRWNERTAPSHASVLRLHQRLLWLRRTAPALRFPERQWFDVTAVDAGTLALRRGGPAAAPVLAVVCLQGRSALDRRLSLPDPGPSSLWIAVLSTEDETFAPDPTPPDIDSAGLAIHFRRPGAVVFRAAARDESNSVDAHVCPKPGSRSS